MILPSMNRRNKMGLDMYLTARKGRGKKEEIGYWRKHHDLHGYFTQLWIDKGKPMSKKLREKRTKDGYNDFNCIPLKLTFKDIEQLEKDIKAHKLPPTEGFFFGYNPPDKESEKEDLEIFGRAKEKLLEGFIVEYFSWW